MRVASPWAPFGLAAALLAGCLGGTEPGADARLPEDPLARITAHRVFASGPDGSALDVEQALAGLTRLVGTVHAVGQPGAEPSVGVTSAGNVFFQAFEKTMRSRDHGHTWEPVADLLTAQDTADPYLWVDSTTDRVFQVNMVAALCSHIAWSDDEGESWLGNPMDCGPVPVNDHIKLGTGPWVGTLSTLTPLNPLYPNAVYYAYNKNVGGFMAVSLDGGATFPLLSMMFPSGCSGALHGAITAAPDGAVYVPARYCPGPLVAYSYDNGVTWENIVVGKDVGVPDQQKNPEVAVDTENNVYLTWVGKDNRLHLSMSRDRAKTWTEPVVASPPAIGSVVWPTLQAGDPGRIGFAYIGTEMSDKGPWAVDNATQWHLYYTYSLNALDPSPTFVTVQVTPSDDPVQRGTICIQSSMCKWGNRNLLDFIDLSLDAEGRPYVAFADGCTSDKCRATGGEPMDSRDRLGSVAVLQAGPSLHAKVGLLEPFAAAPEA